MTAGGPGSALRRESVREAVTLPPADGLPMPRRAWALVAIWMTVALAVMDGAIANIALPTIAQQIGASPSASIWVINAYQLAVAMLLLPFAALGEILGYKRVYQAGLAVFIAGSLGCACGGTLTTLALARFVQGLGAGAIMAVNGALVRFTFPRALLGRGLGYNALVAAVASAAGPSVAASVLAIADWRWLFLINIPLGFAALAMGVRALPATERSARSFDWTSAWLTAGTFAAFFFAITEVTHGRLSLLTAAFLCAGIIAAVVLTRMARGQSEPLVPLDLLRIPILRLSYATSICSFGAQMIGLVALPFYLQTRLGLDHVQAGVMITMIPLGVALAAPVAGQLGEHIPGGVLGCVGLIILSLSYALLALFAAAASDPLLLTMMAGCGIGFGLFQAPNNRTMLSMSPAHRSGAAAGMLATARLVGQMLGAVAVAGLFRTAGTVSVLPFGAAAALGLVAAGFSVSRLRVKI